MEKSRLKAGLFAGTMRIIPWFTGIANINMLDKLKVKEIKFEIDTGFLVCS